MVCVKSLELELLTIAVCQQNISLIDGALQLLSCHHIPSQPCQVTLYLSLALHSFSVLLEIQLERLNIVVKPKSGHGKQNIFTIDCLSLLSLTPLTGLTASKQKLTLLVLSLFDN